MKITAVTFGTNYGFVGSGVMIYLNGFTVPDESAEWNFFLYGAKETCFNTYYPYQFFPKMEFERMAFETVTIFYGGNGTGKTTLLNIIAEKLHLTRNAVFNRSSFFERYVSSCRADIEKTIPKASRIITSDDVFDYLIDLRNLNNGIHAKREELFDEYIENRDSNFRFRTMEDYEKTAYPQNVKLNLHISSRKQRDSIAANSSFQPTRRFSWHCRSPKFIIWIWFRLRLQNGQNLKMFRLISGSLKSTGRISTIHVWTFEG